MEHGFVAEIKIMRQKEQNVIVPINDINSHFLYMFKYYHVRIMII